MKNLTNQTLNLLKMPLLWVFALLAVSADFLIVLQYDRFSTDPKVGAMLLILFALIAEGALIFGAYQTIAERETSFVDSMMTSLTFIPQLIALKIVSLIVAAPGLLLVVIAGQYLYAGIIEAPTNTMAAQFLYSGQSLLIAGLLLLPAILLMTLTQVVTHLTGVAMIGEGASFGESISKAWHVMTQHRRTVLGYVVTFLIIDLLLIGLLMQTNLLTKQSALEFEVLEGTTGARAGTLDVGMNYTSARLFNTYLGTVFSTRGLDVLNSSRMLVESVMGGAVIALSGLLFLPLRSAFLTKLYVESEGIPLPMEKAIRDLPPRSKPVTTTDSAR